MKKRTVKQSRVISLLLAVMMILSSLPFAGISALAEESGDFEYEILADGTAEITDYYGWAETLEIPSTLDGYTVTSIGDWTFAYCYSLTSITIPDSVTSIGRYAFSDCDSLTSITIPESVTSIGLVAFEGCHSLTSINVDENNKNYSSQDGVLFNKGKTELIQYPAGNERTSYGIPNSVTSIGDDAFSYCDSLTNITIPDSVTSIGGNAFYSCDSLTSITVDKNNNAYSSQDGVLFNKA